MDAKYKGFTVNEMQHCTLSVEAIQLSLQGEWDISIFMVQQGLRNELQSPLEAEHTRECKMSTASRCLLEFSITKGSHIL